MGRLRHKAKLPADRRRQASNLQRGKVPLDTGSKVCKGYMAEIFHRLRWGGEGVLGFVSSLLGEESLMAICRALGFVGLSLLSSIGFCGEESRNMRGGVTMEAGPAALPFEISPEGVRELIKGRVAFVLIDAEGTSARVEGNARRIYYTRGPSFRSASEFVFRDRRSGAPKSGTMAGGSQRLAGTPLDWRRLALPLPADLVPERPLPLTAGLLSESIRDGVDLQIVDLRPRQPAGNDPFPKSMLLMPHELLEKPSLISKERWVVLVDDDGQVARPVAEHLFQQGYSLVTILDGGYAAWVRFTGR